MPQDQPAIKINLSPRPKEKIENVFIKWVIHGGRIIIILTEFIALVALSYRFVIDRQIIDLHDQITREQLFVKSQEEKEKEYRSIQGRLANITSINQDTQSRILVMNDVLAILNSGNFVSTSMIMNQNIITVSGAAFSIFSVNDLINNLKQNPSVAAISLDDISSHDKGVEFKLMVELKKFSKI